MKRRAFVMASAAAAGILPTVQAQDGKGTIRRIGVLSENWPRSNENPFGLIRLGWQEGRDLVVDYKWAQGRRDRLDALAAELVAAKPDLLVGLLNPEIMALKRATSTIPILMQFALAPVENGIVASLARPGGNITGTTTNSPELSGKMMQVLRDAVPGIRRTVWLTDLSFPGFSVYTKFIHEAAQSLGLNNEIKDLRTLAGLDAYLAGLERERPDAMFVAMVGAISEHYRQIVDAAARLRIPALYAIRPPVAEGGLMSYAADFRAMALRNGWMIDRILRGTKPADIPVEEPSKFLLTINMKTARALGLTIPQKVLLSADELIE
jgi:putative ABC transport system substrate-binding protein